MSAPIKTVERISHSGGRYIELLHHSDDPTVWIVRKSTKVLWFRWRVSSVWFFNRQQALTFAQKKTTGNLS